MTMRRPAFVLVASLLFTPSTASSQSSLEVIAPGQEELLAGMLGRGAQFPGGCAWAGATVEQTRVMSWYTCANGRVDIELRHPGASVDAVARTEQFAVRVRAGEAPPGLVEALRQRLHAQEGAFHWTHGGSVLTPERRKAARGLGVVFAIALAAAALLIWLSRRVKRWSANPPRSTGAAIAASALAVALVFAMSAAVRQATRVFGDAVLASLEHEASVPLVATAGVMVAYVMLAVGAASIAVRVPMPWPRWAHFVGGILLFLGVMYPRSLFHEDWVPFGNVVPLRPNFVYLETRPHRPAVQYRQDAGGFRGPGFDAAKQAGVVRIVMVGDSYVYGIGVDEADSLPVTLESELRRRDPARRIEVLNLGIPGDNLSSHIDVYAEAQRLAPDVAIIGLTLPNDLSRWDSQSARRASKHLGVFSFARFMFGEAANTLWDLARLERTITPAGLTHLDREMARLAAMRSANPHAPRLVMFTFGELGTPIRRSLERVPGARVLPEAEFWPDDFLPGDGHPSAQGNRRSAVRLADAVEAALHAREQ